MLDVDREIAVPSRAAWAVLTDVALWPRWGPSISGVELDADRLGAGVTGRVTTLVGIRLPFEVTGYEEGRRWSWRVLGIPATEHRVDPLGPDRCRVTFGVPVLAAPYVLVCRRALHHIDRLATEVASG